jgi:hypothetical protein
MSLPDWLLESIHNSHEVAFPILATRVAMSFVLGWVVAAIYYFTQRKPKAECVPLVATLVLLTILIAIITLVIGNSQARAFSLVGALAIIRFRTVVEDTRDTAFVIFAVVVGMAAGAGYGTLAALGIPMVALAAVILSLWDNTTRGLPREGTLNLRVGLGHDPERLLHDIFHEHLARVRLISTATAKQGAALDLTYAIRFRPEQQLIAFVNALNKKEGVQNVEVKL